jgi:diguanylate cyclase
MNEENSLIDQMQTFSEFSRRLEGAKQRASVDALTGLASRAKGEALLRHQLDAGQPVSVVLIDIDSLKQVNELCGHADGDQVLKQMGQTLATEFDFICRWSGDSFLTLTKSGQCLAENEVHRLRTHVSKPYEISEGDRLTLINVSASVGVAQSLPLDTMDDLLARAGSDRQRFRLTNRASVEEQTLIN